MASPQLRGNASLTAFGLSEITLTAGSRLHTAAVVNTRYLLSLPVDSLLYNFRQYAQLDTKGAKPLGGWEVPTSGDRGHFSGHALSALAKASVSLKGTDPDIAASCLANVTYYVSGLSDCQEAIHTAMMRLCADDEDAPPFGYLNAQSPADLDRLETLQECSVPYYTIHKIMAGLFDAYTYTGSQLALTVVSAMADYFAWRFSRLSQWTINQMINTRRYEGQAPAFFMEHGGMLDVLTNVYTATRKPAHLDLVRHFDRRWFLDMLASNNDQLGANAEHSNTELPVVVGLANLASSSLLTPPQTTTYTTAVLNFLGWMRSGHEFVTGGVSGKSAYPAPLDYNSELFNSAGLLDRQINGVPGHPGQQGGESCCAHNLQKSSIYAVQWTHECAWADAFERRFVNCVMAQQHPASGMFLYNLNLAQGSTKQYGDAWDSFWCCYGTGVEAYAQLSSGAAYHDDDQALWLVNYVAATIAWPAQGLSVAVDSAYPKPGAIAMTFTLARPTQLTANLRIPGWATGAVSLLLNGQAVPGVSIAAGTFVAIERQWSSGDVLSLDLPYSLYAEPIPDRADYVGIKYGPHVLVACGPTAATFAGTTQQLLAALTPAAEPCTFTAELQGPVRSQAVTFKPIADVVDESYNGYTIVSQPPAVHVVDSVAIGDAASEQAHDFASLNSGVGAFGGLTWRDAGNNGFLSYRLGVNATRPTYLRCLYLGDDTGGTDGGFWRLFDVQARQADGSWLTFATQSLDAEAPGQWYKVVYPVPRALTAGVESVVFRFQAKGMYGVPGSAGGFFDSIQTYTQGDTSEAQAPALAAAAAPAVAEEGDEEDEWQLVEA